MTTTTEEDRLLTAWKTSRDAVSFQSLCERYVGLVDSVCWRQRSPDVGEAVQAVFLVLARRAGSVAGSSLGAWLTTTAQRVVRDQHRAAARRRRYEQEAAVEQARQRADTEPVWAEAREHLDEALDSLSAGRREAILRFYFAGQPQAEVAAELGCSVAAVKMRVHEGLEHLRAFFARKGIALGAVALASGLASEATASEPALVATCVQTVLNPAAAPGAAALANGVIKAMIIKTTLLATAATILVGSCLTAAVVLGAEPPPPASTAPVPLATAPAPLDPSANAALDWWRAFEFLPKEDDPIWKLADKPNSLLPDPVADNLFTGSCHSLRLLALGAANPYCAWGLDASSEGARADLPYILKMRSLVRLGLLRARWHAVRGENIATVDDLLVCLRASRLYAGHRPTMIDYLVGIRLESITISAAGSLAPRLAVEQRRRLVTGLAELPQGSSVAEALDQNVRMMQWEFGHLLSMPLPARIKGLTIIGAQPTTEEMVSDVNIRIFLEAYQVEQRRWLAHLSLPPAERLIPLSPATNTSALPQPLWNAFSPKWDSIAASEVRLLLLRDQLSAALDYLDRGEPALAGHLDILTGKPFQLEKTATGFRLIASLPGQTKGAELTVGEAPSEAPTTATPASDF